VRESVRHKRLMRHKSIPLLKGNGTTAFPFVQNALPRTPGPLSGRVVVLVVKDLPVVRGRLGVLLGHRK
jgi:hypothetical protein